jgi:hypothetical protein
MPISPLERLPAELLERIMVPTPPADLDVLPGAMGDPKAVPTFDNVLRLIGLQRVSRRLRDLVRDLLMSKAGAVLLADVVRYRIYMTLRGRHHGCRVEYTGALRARLLGLADRCADAAGRAAVCAELHEEATMLGGAPKLREWLIAVAADARDHTYVRARIRFCASDIDAIRSRQYNDQLDNTSGNYAQFTIRTIIHFAQSAGGVWKGAQGVQGAQGVVLWAAAAADIPPPLRRLCAVWVQTARPELPTGDPLSWALGASGSISLRQRIRALREDTRCASLDCVHG